jgi:hypothetical protein
MSMIKHFGDDDEERLRHDDHSMFGPRKGVWWLSKNLT